MKLAQMVSRFEVYLRTRKYKNVEGIHEIHTHKLLYSNLPISRSYYYTWTWLWEFTSCSHEFNGILNFANLPISECGRFRSYLYLCLTMEKFSSYVGLLAGHALSMGSALCCLRYKSKEAAQGKID